MQGRGCPSDSWQLLFDETIKMTVMECIYIYIKSIANNLQRESDAHQINTTEILTFIDLLYLEGIPNLNMSK